MCECWRCLSPASGRVRGKQVETLEAKTLTAFHPGCKTQKSSSLIIGPSAGFPDRVVFVQPVETHCFVRGTTENKTHRHNESMNLMFASQEIILLTRLACYLYDGLAH